MKNCFTEANSCGILYFSKNTAMAAILDLITLIPDELKLIDIKICVIFYYYTKIILMKQNISDDEWVN